MQDIGKFRLNFLRQLAWLWAIVIALGISTIILLVTQNPVGAGLVGFLAIYILILGPFIILTNMTVFTTHKKLQTTGG